MGAVDILCDLAQFNMQCMVEIIGQHRIMRTYCVEIIMRVESSIKERIAIESGLEIGWF